MQVRGGPHLKISATGSIQSVTPMARIPTHSDQSVPRNFRCRKALTLLRPMFLFTFAWLNRISIESVHPAVVCGPAASVERAERDDTLDDPRRSKHRRPKAEERSESRLSKYLQLLSTHSHRIQTNHSQQTQNQIVDTSRSRHFSRAGRQIKRQRNHQLTIVATLTFI